MMIYNDLRTDKMAVRGKDEGGRMKDENGGRDLWCAKCYVVGI